MVRARIPKTSYLVMYVAIALQTTIEFIEKNFGSVRLEQIMFFLAEEDGIVGTEPAVIKSAVLLVFLKPFILLGISYAAGLWVWRKINTANNEPLGTRVAGRWMLRTALITRWLMKHSWILLIASAIALASKVGATTAMDRMTGPDVFSKRYETPKLPLPNPRLTKNLLLIYVESLESSLRNSEVFGANLLEPLDQFFGSAPIPLVPSPGTGWTAAGMISSQCGVPLQNFMGNRLGQKTGRILTSAICLSDQLSARGVRQSFLAGHDVRFSGMNKFYSAHGYDSLTGIRELTERHGLLHEYSGGWGDGLHDDTLLQFAFADIKQIQLRQEPFSYVILTSDNHAPDGFPSPRCQPSEKSAGFKGTFACTSKMIAKFLHDLDNEGLLQNTAVVVMGDHLFFNNPTHDAYFSKITNRSVYFHFRDPTKGSPVQQRSQLTHFDVAPTILEMMTGHTGTYAKFGLGISIFDATDEGYLTHLQDVTREDILNHSDKYKALWAPKQVKVSKQ